ncbi:MAG: hypothetical protein NW220_11715 [Leptolyngbyaceae cyanobacterium bins.349]|nr:hypothetical protein [Leptolyngbyaceae cyanobacterium bins.349]
MKQSVILGRSFGVMLGVLWVIAPLKLATQAQRPPTLDMTPVDINPNVFFRTQSYVAQIIWRRGIPYMTVSNNGWRVLADVRAQVLPARGIADSWTTYTAISGDYLASVRISATGQGAIAVTQAGRRVTEEYAKTTSRQKSIPLQTAPQASTLMAFETPDYAVRVFQQQGKVWMNLYNKNTAALDLSQVPVTLVNTSGATVYRHDGASTIQAREDVRGGRSLLILRDNAIQYRGEAF